jgi:Mg2+ and Co2+ transporter CorA
MATAECSVKVFIENREYRCSVADFLSLPWVIGSQQLQSCALIDVEAPSQGELTALGEAIRLHPLTVEDCLNPDGREKVEAFEKLSWNQRYRH